MFWVCVFDEVVISYVMWFLWLVCFIEICVSGKEVGVKVVCMVCD